MTFSLVGTSTWHCVLVIPCTHYSACHDLTLMSPPSRWGEVLCTFRMMIKSIKVKHCLTEPSLHSPRSQPRNYHSEFIVYCISSEEMDVVDSWLETFTARISGTSELDNLLENIAEHLAHPSFPAICVAIRNAKQLLCSNSCDASLKWAQVAMDFTWEQLHSGTGKM